MQSPDFKSSIFRSKGAPHLLQLCWKNDSENYSKNSLTNNGEILQNAGKKTGCWVPNFKCLVCVGHCAVTCYFTSAVVKVYASEHKFTWNCCLIAVQTHIQQGTRQGWTSGDPAWWCTFVSLWAKSGRARAYSEVRVLTQIQPSGHEGQIMWRKRTQCHVPMGDVGLQTHSRPRLDWSD